MQTTTKTIKLLFLFLFAFGLVEQAAGMLPDRQAFVFFAVHDGNETIAVQSNPLLVADTSGSSAFTLILTEVATAPDGGGSPVLGFVSSPGAISSEINIYATSVVPEEYWSSHATLYGRFELVDSSGGYVNDWESPFILRTIDTIAFDCTPGGDPLPINIGGGLPTPHPPDYEYIGYQMYAEPKGNLLGSNGGTDADIRIDVSANWNQADLSVMAPPYDDTEPVWDIDKGPFDLTITSLSNHSADVCDHHFNGLDYLGNPNQSGQPTLTLRRVPGDANLDGVVDDQDASILSSHWQQQSGATWAMGDFNGDYAVNDIDATIMAVNWGNGGNGAVPEPGTLTLLATCGLTLLGLSVRRRKR